MKEKPTSTLLFHLSDGLKTNIVPIYDKKPMFYWFCDSYHSHLLFDKPAYKYIYFFIVKPKGSARLFTRHGKGDFASLWEDYLQYLAVRSEDRQKGVKRYLEPAIVMSFSEMTPVLTGEFSDDYTVTIINPSSSSNVSFNLLEDGQFRKFNEIPELLELCPEISTSVPIIHPQSSEIYHPERFWAADDENEGRSWL